MERTSPANVDWLSGIRRYRISCIVPVSCVRDACPDDCNQYLYARSVFFQTRSRFCRMAWNSPAFVVGHDMVCRYCGCSHNNRDIVPWSRMEMGVALARNILSVTL